MNVCSVLGREVKSPMEYPHSFLQEGVHSNKTKQLGCTTYFWQKIKMHSRRLSFLSTLPLGVFIQKRVLGKYVFVFIISVGNQVQMQILIYINCSFIFNFRVIISLRISRKQQYFSIQMKNYIICPYCLISSYALNLKP